MKTAQTILKEYNKQDLTTKIGILFALGIFILAMWTVYGIVTGQANVNNLS